MTRAMIGKWGQSLAVRLPADIAAELDLAEKEQVDIEVLDGKLVISPVRRRRRKLTLEALFSGYGEPELEAMREGYAAAAGEFDWGPDQGAEVLPPYEQGDGTKGRIAGTKPTRRRKTATPTGRSGRRAAQ